MSLRFCHVSGSSSQRKQSPLWHIRDPDADLCNVYAPRKDVLGAHPIMFEATQTFAKLAGRQGGKNEGVGGSAEKRRGRGRERETRIAFSGSQADCAPERRRDF